MYSTFGPYHIARAKSLTSLYPDAVFLEIASKSKIYPWEENNSSKSFNLIRLYEDINMEDIPKTKLQIEIVRALDRIRPKVIMFHGLLEPGFKTLALWSMLKRIPAVLHIDSWYGDKIRRELIQKVKGFIYRFVYKAAFTSGARGREYLISMGFPSTKIWTGCDVVDNDYFAEESEKARLNSKDKAILGLPREYFLCVARYSNVKGHHILLKSFRKYKDLGGKWDLVLIGEGPLRDEIWRKIEFLNLQSFVIQKGWISYDILPKYYAYAGCLILPSISEPWGLVANEAAACGLPLILSDKCGCVPELCQHGLNGFVFEAGDAEELAEYMLKISSGEVDLVSFGNKSRELVSKLTPHTWAETVIDIVKTIV